MFMVFRNFIRHRQQTKLRRAVADLFTDLQLRVIGEIKDTLDAVTQYQAARDAVDNVRRWTQHAEKDQLSSEALATRLILELGKLRAIPLPDTDRSEQPSADLQTEVDILRKDIERLLHELGRLDIIGPNPAIDKIRSIGPTAIPYLMTILKRDHDLLLAKVIGLLGDLSATDAIPQLRMLEKSRVAEVSQAAKATLARFENNPTDPKVDFQRPFEHISRIWTAIMQEEENLFSADVLNLYCRNTIEAMPRLQFASDSDHAAAWGMLGDLLYKSLHPDWDRNVRQMITCPEARECYLKAQNYDPKSSITKMRLERV